MRGRAPRAALVAATAVLAASLTLAGCRSADTTLELTGRVSDDSVIVQVPSVALPSPDTAIGGGAPTRGGARSSQPATVAALTQAGSFATIASVEVTAGDRVEAGDVLARLDSDALEAAVTAARATAQAARARVGVLESMRDDLGDKKMTLAEARAKLTDTIAQLEATLADLKAKRAQAAEALARLRALLGSIPGGLRPPGSAPGTPGAGGPPTSTPPGGAPGGLPIGAPSLPDPAELEAAIAKLGSAVAKLESGLGRARSGLARLDDASAKLTDARATLLDATELARVAADASSISVALARQQLSSAVVRSPVAGVVTEIVSEGEVLAPGAPLARVLPARAATVNAWLGFEDVGRVSLGDRVTVTLDSRPGERYAARLVRIGDEALYPPTYVATREVHFGRAVPLEARLDDAEVSLPTGTPVDLAVEGRAPQAEQDR